jgi:2-oxoisovalerate dehydrogenase E1 component
MDYINYFQKEIHKAIEIRLVETKLLELFSQGKLNGTVHTCVGQEFIGVFVSKYLNDEDFVVSNHRGHGHYLSRYDDIKGLVAEVMGRVSGCSGGRGGSQHLFNNNFLSNGIQGGMVPIAAGVSFGFKLNNTDNIAVSYIGDGTLAEGILYESLNLISIYNLPVLIIVENNKYAQSTPTKNMIGGDLETRVLGFGSNYIKTNTWDLFHLDETIRNSVEDIRKSGKSCVLEIDTYRLNSHSKGDDNRADIEIKHFISIDILSNLLIDADDKLKLFLESKKSEIETIIAQIENDDFQCQIINEDFVNKPKTVTERLFPAGNLRYNELIYNALEFVLTNYKNTILIGEDIQNHISGSEKIYGGAFKVTKNLSDIFPKRVFNTPISEAAITGFAAGYSLYNGRAIVEIMFGDFTTLIVDQVLQHISKFALMYDGKIQCPIVIRSPMGGKRGYGPTHSQSIERLFLGIPNFKVLALHHRIDPTYIYESVWKNCNCPFMIIENKILYTIEASKPKLIQYEYLYNDQLFPVLSITPINAIPDLTIICYGEMLNEVEDAAMELMIKEEFYVEIISPTLLSEISFESIQNSIAKTRNLLIIEEGPSFASWGSEVLSNIICAKLNLDKVVRIGNNHLIPSSFKGENLTIPNINTIISTILSEFL